MTKKKKSDQRKRNHARISVRTTEEEYGKIVNQANDLGLHPASMMRKLGCCYQPESTIDPQHITELLRINDDLNRMGGLLKLWLTDDPKVKHFRTYDIDALVNRIHGFLDEMGPAIDKLNKE